MKTIPEVHPDVAPVVIRDLKQAHALGALKERLWSENPEIASLINTVASKVPDRSQADQVVYGMLVMYRMIESQMEANALCDT